MKRITYLFFLFFLLQNTFNLKAQEIHNLSEAILPNQEKISQQSDELLNPVTCFYYDKIAANLSFQMDGDYLLENLTRQIWVESSLSWLNDSLYQYFYNDKNLLDTFIVRKRNNGGVLENAYKETFSYDSNDRLSFSNEWYWQGYWQEYYRSYYTFSSNNNLLYVNRYTWKNPGWLYINKYSYNWNALNDTTRITLEGLDIFYGVWRYFWKVEFSYDSLNSLIKKDKFEYYSLNNWRPELRDLYFYDSNGQNIENIRQDWNSSDSSWVNDYRYLYEYDINSVLLTIVYQDWQQDSLNWKNVWRETYTYTPQNKIATMFKETWSPGTGWNNYVQRTYFYDLNNNWVERITYLWNETIWKNYYRHLATWLVPVSIWETLPYLESYHLYNNYPNPFNPSTKIKFQIPNTEFVLLKVYDLLGNEIVTLVNEEKPTGSYEVEFNGLGLSSGMYFYTLKAGNYIETKKMILIK